MVLFIRVKLRAYSVFKVERIIHPTYLEGDLLKKIVILFRKVSMMLCGLAELCFSQDVNIKVALSSLQFNIIELVLVIRDALGGKHLFAYGY